MILVCPYIALFGGCAFRKTGGKALSALPYFVPATVLEVFAGFYDIQNDF